MKNRIRILVPALTLTLIGTACDRPLTTDPASEPAVLSPETTFSAARAGVSQRFDIAGTLWNRCTGEYVHVTAALTEVYADREDRGGGYHWLSNYALHGTAVGLTSGNTYVYNEIHNMKENGDLPFESLFDDTGAYFFTMSFIATLISQGPLPNQTLQWDIRHKVDSSGAVTIHDVLREFICHG